MNKNAMPIIVGGLGGFGVGFLGDYVNNKYPQKDASDLPIPETDPAYSVWSNKSLWINGGVAILGLGVGLFNKELKLKDEVANGILTAGTVALTKSLGQIVRSYQEDPKYAMYAKRPAMKTAMKRQGMPVKRAMMQKQATVPTYGANLVEIK